MAEYQMSLSHEIEARLKAKCDTLADAFVMDDVGRFYLSLSLCAYELKTDPWHALKNAYL